MRRIAVFHGPSLSHLGRREPGRYGTETLEALNRRVVEYGVSLGADVECRQSNHEGVLIDWLLSADHDGVVLNAGAYAHSSLAIADAIRSIAPVPVVEVHLSNTVSREAARHPAVVGAACRGRIEGFGGDSYLLGVQALVQLWRTTPTKGD